MSSQFVSDIVKAALYAESAALVKAASTGSDQTQALKAFVAGLNARGVYLAEVSKAGTLKPDNKLSVQADAAQRIWDPEGPYHADVSAKNKPAGCGAQVERAKKGANLTQLAATEKLIPVPNSFAGVPESACSKLCECRITENGCIDPSLCTVRHSLAALPNLTRWTFATAGIITGGCNQLCWSGWAHPAVMALLDRFPTCGEIKRLLGRTHKKLLHTGERILLHLTRTYPDGTKLYHFEYLDLTRRSDPRAIRISDALAKIRDTDRIGGSVSEDQNPSSSKSLPMPTSFRPTPAVEALGGLSIVPTFLCALQKSTNFDSFWSPDTFPTDATDISTLWRVNPDQRDLNVVRSSEFAYHYPEELANPRIGERFSDELISRWAYRGETNQTRRPFCVPASYTRSFRANPPIRVALPDFAPITDYLNGALDYETLKAADNAASFSRALGARANRLQQGWESEIAGRWARVRDHAKSGAQTRQYLEFSYRLISRYIGAMAAHDLNASVPGTTVHVANSATLTQITYINAATPIPPPGAPGAPPVIVNGEHDYWDYAAQTALLQGTAQFLDVEGLSRAEIAQALAAIVPTTHENVPFVRNQNPAAQGVARNERLEWLLHIWRNIYPNGVCNVFLHFGNEPLPDQATRNWIQAHANDAPDASIISTVMRHFGSRHDLSSHFEDAIQTALYRTVGYKSADARGADPDKIDNSILDADGHSRLYVPRNNTRWGYFDVFYQPVALSSVVERFLSYSPREIVNIGTILPFCKAIALNWASKALTLLGDEWGMPVAGGNQYLRNHWDKLARHYYQSTVTLWSTIHANALAHQYGFAQPPICRAMEQGEVTDWWLSFQAPYLANHYMELWAAKTMPMFQVLPYYDPDGETSHVQWPGDTPRPVQNWLAFNTARTLKAAREYDPIPGFSWLGDGGPEYNLQFYTAQGNDGQWAKEGGAHKEQLMHGPGETMDQPPVTPTPVPVQQHQYMGPLNNPWADFLLPGSLRSYQTHNRRIRNWSIRQIRETPLTAREAHRWWSAANELPHQSLMVNYLHPFRERRAIEALSDYSVVLWEQDNMFAGLTFSNLFQEINKGDARFDTIRPQQSMFQLSSYAKPRTSEFFNPTRISSSQRYGRINSRRVNKQAGGAYETPATHLKFGSISDEVKERVAAIARGDQAGAITYTTKYPHTTDELPTLEDGVVEYDAHAISALPAERPDPATLAKLARIQNYKQSRMLSSSKC